MSNCAFWRISWKRSRNPGFRYLPRPEDKDPAFECVFGSKGRATLFRNALMKDRQCYGIEILEIKPSSLDSSMLKPKEEGDT